MSDVAFNFSVFRVMGNSSDPVHIDTAPINDGVNSTTVTLTGSVQGPGTSDAVFGYQAYNPVPDFYAFGGSVNTYNVFVFDFADPVGSFSFTAGNVDEGGDDFFGDSVVRVTAIDDNGDPVSITVSGNTHHIVTSSAGQVTVEGEADNSDVGDPFGSSADDVNFLVQGPLSQVTVEFLAGDDLPVSGYVTFGNFVADPEVVCFASGSLITCVDQEPRFVESLSVGDLILTSSGDLRSIRWIGSRKFDAIDLAVNPKLRPVRIRAGALGENMPEEDLWVSRQHRVLVRSAIAQRMFGTDEVLIPAIKLTELDGIEVDEEMQEVEYYHLLFDQHEVICSNGAWTESLFTGPEALKAVSPEARKEIETIFPVICEPDFEPTPARHIPHKGKLMKELIARHKKNHKPIYKT